MTLEVPALGLLAPLNRQIEGTSQPVARAVLRAERAGVLARYGYTDEARRELSWLRTEFERRPDPEIFARLYLAEAWLAYYSDLSPKARDKVHRAYALSKAAGLVELQALSAAWLAHLDYVCLDTQALASHLREALDLSHPDHHAALGRACLVMAEAYHLARRTDLAQPWYAEARRHALAQEDVLTLRALNHNMAWHRSLHAIQASVRGGHAEAEARHALTLAQATHQLDAWRGVRALPASIQVASALAHSVLGHFEQALALYETHAPKADAQGLRALRPLILADMAWCCHHTGQQALLLHYLQAAVDALPWAQQADNLAIAHGRLAQLFALRGDSALAVFHHEQAQQNGCRHTKILDHMLEVLGGLSQCWSVSPAINRTICSMRYSARPTLPGHEYRSSRRVVVDDGGRRTMPTVKESAQRAH